MDFTTLTIDVLKMLSVAGSYGIGIISIINGASLLKHKNNITF